MKFAKDLAEELVAEWEGKYVDYKAGKKKIKKIISAIKKANATPKTPASRLPDDIISSPVARRTPLSQVNNTQYNEDPPINVSPENQDRARRSSQPLAVPERQSLKNSPEGKAHRYGSIGPPPSRAAPPFDLPDPAMNPQLRRSMSASVTPNAFQVGGTTSPSKNPFSRRTLPRQTTSSGESPQSFLQRVASRSWNRPSADAELRRLSYLTNPVATAERDFFEWMDSELDKVEKFYKEMEDKNAERLKTLREQLHEFVARRKQELEDLHKGGDSANGLSKDQKYYGLDSGNGPSIFSRERISEYIGPLGKSLGPHPGSNSRALQRMPTISPSVLSRERGALSAGRHLETGRDYVQKRPVEPEGPKYRSAKHKLQLAIREFYRGLELLKAYTLLNSKAFRKINKKYDKAVNSQKPLRYMSEKVNKAYFAQSEVTEAQIRDVEDLYARYFYKGKRKVAVEKLRTTPARRTDYYLFGINNGLLVGIGGVFAVQGLIFAAQILLHNPSQTVRSETSYLLQLYGGYFLCLYLFFWFCFDCIVWSKHKINYPFIFEFDPRHRLDWQELINFPSFFSLLLGLFLWLNFSGYGSEAMFTWYPVVLIGVTVGVIFFPFPSIYGRSRLWFVYSHWRLLCSGAYPVEFRDFFLGDMYSSLTYATANIELFFCLYIPTKHWLNPGQCNSSNTSYKGRLLGFCSAIPAIWRALQCIRRYADSGDKYPHLANCGKYIMTIVYYTTLSLYRINDRPATKSAFIIFAALSAIYATFWDLVNDWSLCQPHANARFLRDTRGFKNKQWYYTAMIVDPILRFNWIFYAIYTHEAGHASLVSFLVAFSEVTRRGMWTLFRVENEHCTNVGRYRALRDLPLPYKLGYTSQESVSPVENDDAAEAVRAKQDENGIPSHQAPGSPSRARRRPPLDRPESGDGTSSKAPSQEGGSSSILRRRPTMAQMFAEAHAKDFVKKNPDEAPVDLEANHHRNERYEESDDDSDSDPTPEGSGERDDGRMPL